MNEILKKIHSTGYWRVNIRPIEFKKNTISSLTDAHQIMEKCGVLLRGWDYPHFTNAQITNGDDWIESSIEFEGHIEYWRLYLSGQFIHHFACREDYEVDPKNLSQMSVPSPSQSGNYLSILSTLFTITEIFEFASRLATQNVLSSPIFLSITLDGMKGRQLFFWERSRYLSKAYISGIDKISYEDKYTKEYLISDAPKISMRTTIHIFERFNWAHHSDILFPEEQKKLLERRL